MLIKFNVFDLFSVFQNATEPKLCNFHFQEILHLKLYSQTDKSSSSHEHCMQQSLLSKYKSSENHFSIRIFTLIPDHISDLEHFWSLHQVHMTRYSLTLFHRITWNPLNYVPNHHINILTYITNIKHFFSNHTVITDINLYLPDPLLVTTFRLWVRVAYKRIKLGIGAFIFCLSVAAS